MISEYQFAKEVIVMHDTPIFDANQSRLALIVEIYDLQEMYGKTYASGDCLSIH